VHVMTQTASEPVGPRATGPARSDRTAHGAPAEVAGDVWPSSPPPRVARIAAKARWEAARWVVGLDACPQHVRSRGGQAACGASPGVRGLSRDGVGKACCCAYPPSHTSIQPRVVVCHPAPVPA
jgi:hypothetical protein